MTHLVIKSAMVVVTLVLVAAACSASYASVPDPDSVAAMAIYRASVDTGGDWSDSLVSYNVTDPDTISALLLGIEADTLRDCSYLETKNSAYIYVKLNNGTREVYNLFLVWSHFSLAGDRGNCYYVTKNCRDVFMRHAQD